MPLTEQHLGDLGLEVLQAPIFFRSLAEIESGDRLHPYSHFMRRAWETMRLDGILCVDRKPTVYFKEVARFEEDRLAELHRMLWNQGIATVLVVTSPGAVRVYSGMAPPKGRINNQDVDLALVETLDRVADALEIKRLLTKVESGRLYRDYPAHFPQQRTVDQTLLDNLSAARDLLHAKGKGLAQKTAHAFLGRVIFTCYLTDRGIITEREFKAAGAPAGVANLRELLGQLTPTAAKRALYKLWSDLHDVFNGSMFDETVAHEAAQIHETEIGILHRFLNGEELVSGQLTFGLWVYNFEVIPIETISAIYEDFLSVEDIARQKRSGAFYTPKHLAEMVVDVAIEAWDSLLDKRILDPSCGSGIFLVVLFNRIAEEWRRANPNVWNKTRAKKLLEIIQRQLCGVDINETACRISCFSLYLAFLDQLAPREIHELHTDGAKVLPNLLALKGDQHRTTTTPVIFEGSFFDDLPIGRDFDLVIGNPPWVGRNEDNAHAFAWCTSSANPAANGAPRAKAALKAYFMPQDQLAHAFMWKAPVHLKPTGRTCLLLPSKVLLNHTTDTFQAGWITANRVEKVVLLSDYRFILFENAISPATIVRTQAIAQSAKDYDIILEVPKVDGADPRRGAITVGTEDRQTINSREIVAEAKRGYAPVVWKKRFWGSPRDLEFLERLGEYPSLATVIEKHRWVKGQGMQPDYTKKDFLKPWWKSSDLFIDAKSSAIDLSLLASDCEKIGDRFPRLRRSPDRAIFRGPMVLVSQGFSKRAFVNFDVIFQDSLQAIAGPEKDAPLLRFLTAVLRSRLAEYFLFHTAANWGTERDKVHFFELLRLPFPLPEQTDDPTRARAIVRDVGRHFEAFEKEQAKSILARDELTTRFNTAVEPLIEEYYGVTRTERLLIADTLDLFECSITPHAFEAKVPTLQTPDESFRTAYAQRLTGILNHLGKRGPHRLKARTLLSTATSMAVVILEKTAVAQPYVESESDKDLNRVLQRLSKLLPEQQGRFAHMRDLKIFSSNEIFLVKPLTQRAWSQSAALNDADELVAAILRVR